MNEVILVGRVADKPELRSDKFATVSLATDRYVKDGDNITDWHNVSIIGKAAKRAAEHINKGDRIGVSGTLQYTKKDDRKYTNVVCFNFEFLSGKQNGATKEAPKKATKEVEQEAEQEDDLPF